MKSLLALAFASLVIAGSNLGCSSSSTDPGPTGSESAVKQGASEEHVTGRVTLTGDTTGLTFPFSGVVTVEDVTNEDDASVTIGTQTITVTGVGPIEFTVPVSGIDATASYNVRVHVDTGGDGKVSKGDFLTQESFPVLNEHGSDVDVRAKGY